MYIYVCGFLGAVKRGVTYFVRRFGSEDNKVVASFTEKLKRKSVIIRKGKEKQWGKKQRRLRRIISIYHTLILGLEFYPLGALLCDYFGDGF